MCAKRPQDSETPLLPTKTPTPTPTTEQPPSPTDILISTLLITPLVVGCWRSLWTIADLHPEYVPPVPTYLLTTLILVVFTLCRWQLSATAEVSGCYRALAACYTFASFAVGALHWRSVWASLDEYLEDNWTSPVLLGFTLACAGGLVAVRATRSVMAPPFAVSVDVREGMFAFPTRFGVGLKEKNLFFYILDCLFSVFVVGTLVVFIWRGVWALLDLHLFPQNEEWSAFASLIIGYACVAVAFLMQPLMKKICEHLKGVFRILSADIFVLFSLFGTVNVWRGIWNLLNLYFIPDNVELSCWIAHWVCLSLLLVLRCSNSLLVRGVYIDGEEPAGECVVFPCHYLRLLVHEEQLKKLKAKVRPEPDGGGVFVVELNHHAGKKDAEVEGEAKKKGAKEDGVA